MTTKIRSSAQKRALKGGILTSIACSVAQKGFKFFANHAILRRRKRKGRAESVLVGIIKVSYWTCEECGLDYNLLDKDLVKWDRRGCCDDCAAEMGEREDFEGIDGGGEVPRAGSLGDIAGDD